MVCFFLSACIEPPTLLERIKKNGELKVLTRNSPGIYYEGPFGPTGFEYDLLKRFSNSLGVALTVIIEPNAEELLTKLSLHNGHFAAAKLTITPQRQQHYLFTQPYHEIVSQLVYHSATRKPKQLKDINNQTLEISDDNSLVDDLKILKKNWKTLDWTINHEASPEDLIVRVNERLIDFTIVSSDEIKLNRHFYPELRVAFDMSKVKQIGWAFAKSEDTSLYDKANQFLAQQKKSGQMQHLIDQHFGHIQSFDYVGTRVYKQHIITRLPSYQPWFEKAGKDNNIEWILLAAMAYQESHWNKDAISPTGVRGLMMLTRNTAKDIGINNRVEPHQSIFGGAYYFAKLLTRLPEKVTGIDRVFFALASYNLGYWHVRDAMTLTQKSGHDESKWSNLKKTLPLLRKKKWHKQTRYGYARGDEAVKYVENIRSYYDILKWEVSRSWQKELPQKTTKALKITPSAL
ncbi:MAG: membrane-bound lytic murein transglycosylase MltF [gamma proteobacterium symbiont of Bathyaustriella thionipta]|nr:membrane-bound lytic murein transglycosylase MltF [gamma proteobacterium symbiont of Bathyaustriella thionipta]MCU7950966.1 membrane-bound lytic murein transglycosylase MltF [gamma proteobacterium symbiont of Bathyaustriella thionipta]MCU7953195.1 membrane-bound lytic murein transglycosylase MltF [gamma proteobacterium symbiont of Bathyaustriella thionipta]MCU7957454.1 membrane-bound lytic murein transglycosylase MltF [gamma proteobacterium symbiont of Bathyaustriella thionipta]MCU7968400.1 